MLFNKIRESIYKLNIPFEDGFTSVFALENDGRYILVDFAASDYDSDRYIIPAIKELNFTPEYLLCTHIHNDHCGGINHLAEEYKNAKIMAFSEDFKVENRKVHLLSDGEVLLERYEILNLKGHTNDSAGILDTKQGILLCADSLQGKGIGRYGTNIENPEGYINTLKRVSELDLNGIIASHDYEPCGSTAFGKTAVSDYIAASAEELDYITSIIKSHPTADAEEIAAICNSVKSRPRISPWCTHNIIDYLNSK